MAQPPRAGHLRTATSRPAGPPGPAGRRIVRGERGRATRALGSQHLLRGARIRPSSKRSPTAPPPGAEPLPGPGPRTTGPPPRAPIHSARDRPAPDRCPDRFVSTRARLSRRIPARRQDLPESRLTAVRPSPRRGQRRARFPQLSCPGMSCHADPRHRPPARPFGHPTATLHQTGASAPQAERTPHVQHRLPSPRIRQPLRGTDAGQPLGRASGHRRPQIVSITWFPGQRRRFPVAHRRLPHRDPALCAAAVRPPVSAQKKAPNRLGDPRPDHPVPRSLPRHPHPKGHARPQFFASV